MARKRKLPRGIRRRSGPLGVTYEAQFRRGGHRLYKNHDTLEEAEAWLAEKLVEYRNGELTAQQQRRVARVRTLEAATERYIDRWQPDGDRAASQALPERVSLLPHRIQPAERCHPGAGGLSRL